MRYFISTWMGKMTMKKNKTTVIRMVHMIRLGSKLSLLLVLLAESLPIQHVVAFSSPKSTNIGNDKTDQEETKTIATTRRDVIISSAAVITGSATNLLVPPSSAAVAATTDGFYIPGVAGGARRVDLIVDESNNNNNNTNTEEAPAATGTWNPQPFLTTKLGKSRILANELTPLSQSVIPFASDNELYYDAFLSGAWKVTATLRRKTFPYGINYVPSKSLYEGSPRKRNEVPGDVTTYQVRYGENRRKNGIQQDNTPTKISSDRTYNAKSLNAAYDQFSTIDEVQWDPKKDPTRLTLNYSTLGKDLQPLGKKKTEVYITARKSESFQVVDSDTNTNTSTQIFCAAERVRSVTSLPGNVIVTDTETITEFHHRVNDTTVQAISRIAVYLTPNPNSKEGILWQDVNGKAVALYDYDIDLERV